MAIAWRTNSCWSGVKLDVHKLTVRIVEHCVKGGCLCGISSIVTQAGHWVDRCRTPCRAPAVEVDTDEFRAGGTVTVTVHCPTTMSDVALIGLPGERTFTATAVEVIDTYRADGP